MNNPILDKIFYDYENIVDDFKDFDETKSISDNMTEYIKKIGNDFDFQLEDLINQYANAKERQGFQYGFDFALRLILAR